MPHVRPFSDAYLFEYSGEHLTYEVDIFFGAVEEQDSPPILGSRRLLFFILEAFVMHLRNLTDFLYLPPGDTDVVAGDFYDAGAWEKLRPPLSDMLKAARRRANKELAHLTTDRIIGAPPEKDWDLDSLAEEIRPILKTFVANANRNRLSPRVAAAIR